jgi:hypothetical protein
VGSSLDFERTEDGIDDGSLDLDGINEGNFGSLLDSDGTTDDGSLNFDGTADGNVEGSLDFDGTEDDIVIAIFDRKTPSSMSSESLSPQGYSVNASLCSTGGGCSTIFACLWS